MGSTVIAILLAAVVIFWRAPFSLMTMLRVLHCRWHWVLFVLLLIALFATQTHAPNNPSSPDKLGDKRLLLGCKIIESSPRWDWTFPVLVEQ
ncbi:MAG: hypothetical protein ONB44_17440 [candidate division KSB1 bacterium]|nr:hypothetical protein [candidate division KSB1 bacterium]